MFDRWSLFPGLKRCQMGAYVTQSGAVLIQVEVQIDRPSFPKASPASDSSASSAPHRLSFPCHRCAARSLIRLLFTTASGSSRSRGETSTNSPSSPLRGRCAQLPRYRLNIRKPRLYRSAASRPNAIPPICPALSVLECGLSIAV